MFDETKKTEIQEDRKPESLNSDSTIDAITDSIVERIPEVSEHVIESEASDEFEASSKVISPEFVDVEGTVFNSEIHVTDESGNPVKTAKGKFRKKPGVKPGKKTAQNDNFNSQLNIDDSGSQAPNNTRDSAVIDNHSQQSNPDAVFLSKMGALANSQIRCALGGEKASSEELEYLETAIKNWCDETGVSTSPTTSLIMALSVFHLPVVTAPKEKNVFTKGFKAVKTWFKFRKKSQVPEGEKLNGVKQ